MSEDNEQTEDQGKGQSDQTSVSPGPGHPTGDVTPFGEEETGEDPTNARGTPPISGEEQHEGQTSHPAPDDDVGVPEDVGD